MDKIDNMDMNFDSELTLVEKEIKKILTTDQQLLRKISLYVINSGGKKIRPLVCLLSFKAVGGKDIKKVMPIAAAYEIIHNATIIHDDINDGGTTRRGFSTVNKIFGNTPALITGDFFFVKGFGVGGQYGAEVVKITADACTKLAEGEILQNQHIKDIDLSENTYFEIILRKTAMPISAGARVGALLGGGESEHLEGLSDYGLNLGVAFQLVDDILDVIGDRGAIGKPLGVDILEGKLTLMTIYTLKKCSRTDKERLSAIILKNDKTEVDVLEAVAIFKKYNAIEYTQNVAEMYIRKAIEDLQVLPESKQRDRLETLAEYVVKRKY